MSIQRKQPPKRAFSGLVGPPPDLSEDSAPAPNLVSVAPPSPSPTEPTPRGGLAGLASQEYRAPRDLTSGKVIEMKPCAEAQARALFGIAPPSPSRLTTPMVSNKFPSMRQTLMLDAEDLIALFDANDATKIGEREVFEEMDFFVPPKMLEHRIERLKKLIAASKAIIEGLSVRIMKLHRGADEVLDKATREKFKREENARVARSNAKLFRYRAALRSGNYTEKIWRYQTQTGYFRDLVDDCMTFEDRGEAYYEMGKPMTFEGTTYSTTNLVCDIIESGIFDVSRYEVVMRLDEAALRLLGESDDDHRRSWAYWQRWENAIIKAAVFYGVLRPRKDLLELLALSPYVQETLEALDGEIEADETENALALKTGGACYGGGIHGGGYRYSRSESGTVRQRSLESFDKGPPKRDTLDGDGGEDSGFTSLRDINDDAESYQPR
jgi:hypothetical protein